MVRNPRVTRVFRNIQKGHEEAHTDRFDGFAAYTLLPTPFHLRLPIPRSQWPVRRPCTQCPVRCVAMGIEAETQTQNIRKPTAKLDEQRRE